MKKIIILSVIMLIGGLTNAGETFTQMICASIDKNTHDSRWTTRDNTAKMQYNLEYTRHKKFSMGLWKNLRRHGTFEIHYGDAPKCFELNIPTYYTEAKKEPFTGKISVAVQYGADCSFRLSEEDTIDVILRKRSGNLVEPWACTTKPR